MKDELGDRIKEQYEDRTRYLLPRRTYTIIRLDGKAFHTYTRNLKKPFDKDLSDDIDNAIINTVKQIQGARFAYTQSDEISILLTDFETENTDAWFDSNLQKICSVSSSIITAEFNKIRTLRNQLNWNANRTSEHPAEVRLAYFDSRVFTIPDRTEVMNYFIWRNQDCARNSLSMVAHANFSHKQLERKNSKGKHDMLYQKGINWATDFTDAEKNGRLILKKTVQGLFPVKGGKPGEMAETERSKWVITPAWKFTENKDKLLEMIPSYGSK